jgi:hypothetical protein
MTEPAWAFEQEPYDETPDETTRSLRGYFDRMPDAKLREYRPDWSNDQLVEWDGHFRDDGYLMMVCCDREVDVIEYREVLEECIRYRDRVRS